MWKQGGDGTSVRVASYGSLQRERLTFMAGRDPHGSPADGAAAASRLLLGASLLSLAACGGESYTKLFETEHFVYYAQEGPSLPCDGTAQWLERYYSANAKFLGVTLPPGEQIEYYLLESTEPLAQFGCEIEGTGGCTDGTTIHSHLKVHAHEIVHANASLLGRPPQLFKEGLAEVLGCWTTSEGPDDMSAPIEILVESGSFLDWSSNSGAVAYHESASFVRYLIDRFGTSRFLSFYARAPERGDREEIDSVFQEEMGVALDDAFSDWRQRPAPYGSDWCLRLMECDPSMPPLVDHPAGPAGVDTEVTLGCATTGASNQPEALRRFEVPEGGTVYVTTEPLQAAYEKPPRVQFYRCTGGGANGVFEHTSGFGVNADGKAGLDPAEPTRTFALNVSPGAYVAWFTGREEATINVKLVERGSPMRDTPCQAAEDPLVLEDERQTTLMTRWIERPCDGPWCPGQGWDVSIGATGGAVEAQIVSAGASFSPGEIYICSDPCPEDASECEVLVLDPEGGQVQSKQIFEPGAVLHLGAPTAVYADRFSVELRVAPQ